jgi:hypothetical protein
LEQISVTWEPWHQERPAVRIRVITPDYVVHDLDLKTLTDAPARDEQSNIYSDRRVIGGPLPAVAPGSVVEQESVVRENTPYFSAGTVGRYFFGRVSVPVRHSRFAIEAPSSVSLHYMMQLLPDLQPQKTESDGKVRIVFERGAIDSLEMADSYLPADMPAYPSVAFSTGTSWQLVAGDYAAIVESKIKSGDVKAIVEKLTRGKQSQFEKVQAISGYSIRRFDTQGWNLLMRKSFLIPRMKLSYANTVQGQINSACCNASGGWRSGLLGTLERGRKDGCAWRSSRHGFFDHAIVYVPGSPDLWIDATDEFGRLRQLPTSDPGPACSRGSPETNALIRTPQASSPDNLLAEFREVHLAEYSPARISERTQPHGSNESSYRRSYADKQSKTTQDNLTSYVKTQYLVEKLDKLDRSDPDDLSHQFELVLESNRAKRGFTDLKIAVTAFDWTLCSIVYP